MPPNEIKKVNRTYRLFKLGSWDRYKIPPQGDVAARDIILEFANDKGILIPQPLAEKYLLRIKKEKTNSKTNSLIQALKDNLLWTRSANYNPEAVGRYTLEGADHLLAKETNHSEGELLPLLIQAVRDNHIPVYKPRSGIPFKPKDIHSFYEEVYWYDLNGWLDDRPEIKIDWRFPKPLPAPPEPKESATDRRKRMIEHAVRIYERRIRKKMSVKKDAITKELFDSDEYPDIDRETIHRDYTLQKLKESLRISKSP